MSQSYYYDILAGLKARVEDAIAGESPVPVVALRKRPVQLAGDPFPMIVISPTEDGEIVGDEDFDGGTTYVYPVVVAMFFRGDREQTLDPGSYLGIRQKVRNAVYKPLMAGVGTVFDVQMNPAGPFIQTELRQNVDVTNIRLNFLSREIREV
jgi:hypothetical protein